MAETTHPVPTTDAVQLNAQYLKDLSFESPNAPAIFATPPTSEPRLEVAVNVQTQALGQAQDPSTTMFEITLRVRTEAKFGDKTGFIVELSYAGVATLPKNISEPQRKHLLLVEAPRQLFPFARAIVADAVRDGGFPPVLLSPIDFTTMVRDSEARAKAAS